MAKCRNCQAGLKPGQKYCSNCGTLVAAAAESSPVASSLAEGQTSLQRSLAVLGIPISLNMIIGFFVALVVGLIVPRILPYIFPLFYPILDFVFQGNPDPFNRLMMTGLTFLSSFAVSFFIAYIPRRLLGR